MGIKKRTLVYAVAVFFLSFSVEAQIPSKIAGDLESSTTVLALTVSNVLSETELALTAVSDVFQRDPNVQPIVMHGTLKRYAKLAAGLRAILVTDPQGQLIVDSYNYPPDDLDLSDRAYIRAAQISETDDIYFGKPVVGRSSGVPFVPVSRPVRSFSGKLIGVAIGIITPRDLIPHEVKCRFCVYSIMSENNGVIAIEPPETKISSSFFGQVDLINHASGFFRSKFNLLGSTTHWRKIDHFPAYVAVTLVHANP